MPLDIDRFAHLASPLQRWDPRFKTFSLGLFILGVALIKAIPLSVAALVVALMLVWMAGLPFHFVARRHPASRYLRGGRISRNNRIVDGILCGLRVLLP